MLTIRIYKKKSVFQNELTSVYLNGVASINFEEKYINYSPDGNTDWQTIQYDYIECDYTNSCFDVHIKE